MHKLGLEHKVFDQKKFFKDHITQAHINTVEGMNHGLKLSIPHRNRAKKGKKMHFNLLYVEKQHEGIKLEAIIPALKEFNKIWPMKTFLFVI